MARADQYTWLPLERWRELLGICPFSFNQLVSEDGLVPSGDCGEVWFQHAYQNTDYTAREDVAEAIRGAERNIASEAGYHLLPQAHQLLRMARLVAGQMDGQLRH